MALSTILSLGTLAIGAMAAIAILDAADANNRVIDRQMAVERKAVAEQRRDEARGERKRTQAARQRCREDRERAWDRALRNGRWDRPKEPRSCRKLRG